MTITGNGRAQLIEGSKSDVIAELNSREGIQIVAMTASMTLDYMAVMIWQPNV